MTKQKLYKVSVIIPVYNAAPHLPACVGSLLNQTLEECEFIFVNDGSTDGSGAILAHYQSLDPRIKLIEQTNQGVSLARNAGLAAAAGEYVGFVDADDYVEPDMYERLYEAADGCDVIVSNMESDMEGRAIVTRYPFRVNELLGREYIQDEILPFFLMADQLNTAVNKLYRRSVAIKGGVSFPAQVPLGEDGMFNMLFFSCAATMKYIDYTGYHYREVAGSATRNIAGKDYFNLALEVYRTEPPVFYREIMPPGQIERLKSVRLIHSTIAYIYVYFKPSKDMSLRQRYRYVKRMITDPYVRGALPFYYENRSGTIGRYEKWLLAMIRAKFTFGLMCAAAYSRIRSA
ncbi:glycosyltransferase [Paenibacillus nasutitermitis]|uniref:Glycosyltransferase EpsJ n=1 Tax=Paenibacillus nasutitermitis TaxID=1652958 RepID=A0A916Z2R2_9BACL|nr:glycosyltransferase [Paenibacillus nasutitermitis]GGD73278.1 putative glycosyltransferase EpsJ [Paenibacillus nasutitermitis]